MAKFLSGLGLFLVTLAVIRAVPANASPQTESRASLVQEFDWIRQGQVGILHLSGEGIQWAYAKFMRQTFLFFPDPRCGEKCIDQIAVLSAPMTATLEFHPLTVKVYYEDGSDETIEDSIRVNASGRFRPSVFIALS